MHCRAEPYIVGDCQVWKDAMAVQNQTEAKPCEFLRVASADISALEVHRAAAGLDEADNRTEQCRLSRAIRAKHQKDFARSKLQIDSPQHRDAAIAGMEGARLKHRARHSAAIPQRGLAREDPRVYRAAARS